MPRLLAPAATGLLAACAGVAVAELLAAATRPAGSPVVAVGGAVIDATPTPVKEWAVRNFGTADKPLLLAGIALALAALAALTGILAAHRRRFAILGAAGLGLTGAAAVLSRPTTTPGDLIPALAGVLVAGTALHLLLGRRPHRQPSTNPPLASAAPASAAPSGTSRRTLLVTAGLVIAGTAVAGTGAVALRRADARATDQARAAVRLPAPADPAPPLPAGTAAGFYTPNAEFYRVDTALTVPQIDPASWTLTIHGMVDRPLRLRYDDLLRMPLTERDITLNCVSNEVGGPYIGTARWLGVPLDQLLRQAGITAGADQLVARSVEGMTIGTPTATILDGRDTLLAVAMNGQPLPAAHGFPVRVLTPGLYGYAGSCKWITELELTTFDAFDPYWVRRGWATEGPVKTSSRIDRPAPLSTMAAGATTIAGVAWAQRRGIDQVQLQIDDQDWQPAQLLPTASPDTWVQWRHRWQATPGRHTLRVRAIDATGDMQPGQRADPYPDGATGWHTIQITVQPPP